MERDGMANIAGAAKHVSDDYRIREALQELPAASNLRAAAFGAGDGKGNSPLWHGHIIDAIFPLV